MSLKELLYTLLTKNFGLLKPSCLNSARNRQLNLFVDVISHICMSLAFQRTKERAMKIENGVLVAIESRDIVNGKLDLSSRNIRKIGDEIGQFCHYIRAVVFPESLEEIGHKVFAYCLNLTEVRFPTGIKKIGRFAFTRCPLGSVTFYGEMEEIGSYAFLDCSLTKATFYPGLINNGKKAFSNCALEEMTLSFGFDTIHSEAFDSCPNLRIIYVRCGNEEDFSSVLQVLPEHMRSLATKVPYSRSKSARSVVVAHAETPSLASFFPNTNYQKRQQKLNERMYGQLRL